MNKKKQYSFGRLIQYLFLHYKIKLIATIICIVISSFASTIATIFIQRLIDECIIPGVNQGFEPVAGKFTSILITMGFIYICGVIASLTYNQIMAIVSQGTLKNFRNDMFDKMQTLPIKYFDTNAHGDIMSTYTNDADAIRQFIGQSIPTLIQSVLSVTVMFLTMLYYSIWLTLVVMIVIFFMLKIAKKLGSTTATFMIKQQKSLAKEEGFIEEMMQGMKVVKVFCHEDENKEAFKQLNEQLFKDGEKANQNGNVLMPILGNVGNLMYVLLAIVGGIMVYLKTPNLSLTGVSIVSIGIIVSFLGMSRQLSQTIGQASMQVSMIAMGLAGATRIFELLDDQPEEDHGYVTLINAKKDLNGNLIETKEKTEMWAWKHPHQDGTTTLTELKGDVRLEDVDFGYVPEKLVLDNVSLFAKPGQKIAFVGATGAGKTTITNLINRFYDIWEGKIRYDGINISKIKKPDLRSSLGVVLQDVNLFTDTVLENIRYGRLDATDEECIAAAKLANADDFITRLPDGYQTMLTGNGSSLSQGQRQLISIARAAVADPPAMILDEATSSIDTRTEALIQAGMDNLMKGRTVFVIAHRLSTVKNSDAIMVLDHGKVIERGSHESLIEQKGTYYQLYTGAFELE